MTFTKGPWVDYQFGSDWYVNDGHDDSGPMLCVRGPHANREANARLIAAAPELLDACQVAIGHMTGGMDGDWRDCDPVSVLRAAIAKATGAS